MKFCTVNTQSSAFTWPQFGSDTVSPSGHQGYRIPLSQPIWPWVFECPHQTDSSEKLLFHAESAPRFCQRHMEKMKSPSGTNRPPRFNVSRASKRLFSFMTFDLNAALLGRGGFLYTSEFPVRLMSAMEGGGQTSMQDGTLVKGFTGMIV